MGLGPAGILVIILEIEMASQSTATRTPVTQPLGTAVITGASSGIGAVYADRLARRGHDLVLVARDRRRLEYMAAQMRKETGHQIDVLVADLTSKVDLRFVEERLRNDSRITMLVNNAGMGNAEPLALADVDLMERLIDLNVTAFTRIAAAVTPGFVARERGTIINISSIVALQPELLTTVYSGSKAYVLAFTQVMQTELGKHGVRVQAVLPGATRTEIWTRAGIDLAQFPDEVVMSAEEMVDAALSGLDQGELVTIPSLPDIGDWVSYNQARKALQPNLSRNVAAPRYKRPRSAIA
jgi:hypothetical protein